jgi:hypothetical protein
MHHALYILAGQFWRGIFGGKILAGKMGGKFFAGFHDIASWLVLRF